MKYLRLQLLRFKTLRAYRSLDWRQTPIKECGQRLVEIPSEWSYPFYAKEMNLVSDQRLFLRESLVVMLEKVRYIFQKKGLQLMVYDGWRSIELQENLFWHYLKIFTVAKHNLEYYFEPAKTPSEIKDAFYRLGFVRQNELMESNRQYVSWPSKDPFCPSPHVTGGSVDIWLFKDGVPLNLGVPFDCMHEEAGAFYHLKLRRKSFKGIDSQIASLRSTLLLTMSSVGFSCYGPEFWHFNFGNQMDSIVSGKIPPFMVTKRYLDLYTAQNLHILGN